MSLPFACSINGPVDCPAAGPTLWSIYQAIFGWDSVETLADGALGRNVESRSEFEERRRLSVAVNAVGILDSILASVLAVEDVLDAFVTENEFGVPQLIGGYLLGSNSIYVAALGGDSLAVATAIWHHKAPGCGYNGNTVEVVVDPSPEYQPPIPSYAVLFERPNVVDFAVKVVLRNNTGIPSNARALIQAAIISAFAGSDGGPRAKIGSQVLASRYYAGVIALGPWAQIIDIQLGIDGSASEFTASSVGNILTVSSVLNGTIAVGQLLEGTGVASGTTIIATISGTGGTGTYRLSSTQTILSQSVRATQMLNDVQMRIDQAPSVTADNIHYATALS